MTLPFGAAYAQGSAQATPELNAWVVVRPDDTVVVRFARSEMGQGALTGLCQLVAEELECDWSKVTWEYVDPRENIRRKRIYGNFNSTGSNAIRQSHDYVRRGGAAARQMLIQAAANEWKVPASECTAANSLITHTPSGRKTSYGKVVTAATKIEPPDPKSITLKDPKVWKIAGKPIKRLDTMDKLTGKQKYSADTQLPGMLNAAIKACPVRGGKLVSFDAAKVKGMKGVKNVLNVGGTAVAVVADTWWHAKTALDALPVVWDEGPGAKVSSETIAAVLTEGLDAETPLVGNKGGDIAAALAGAAKKVEAVYAYPYQNHACMEPLNATARYTAEKCEVWTSTQNAEAVLAAAGGSLGPAVRQCRGHRGHRRRRLRPARPHRLRDAGGADRQADARRADQAAVVARRGHDPGHLPSDHAVQAHRGVGCQQQRDRPAHPHFGPVDPRRHRAGASGERA